MAQPFWELLNIDAEHFFGDTTKTCPNNVEFMSSLYENVANQ